MIIIVLPLSACAIIAFSVASFWFSFFITYSCLSCRGFWWLVELKICFNLWVARMCYVFCTFLSRSFMAHSVSARRLARYVVVGFSMM
jgi:hypothetical protein